MNVHNSIRGTVVLLAAVVACSRPTADENAEHITAAERYFRAVYSSDTATVDDLVADSITISYPVFQKLFGAPTIHGRDAVKAFVIGFGQRWADPTIEYDQTVAEGDRVVLVWSGSARNVGAVAPDQPADSAVHSWGGITLIRFNANGKIVAEVGEESEPGPTARMEGAAPY